MECIWVKESQGDYDVIDNKHDKGYKYLLSAKKIFIELLRTFVKQGWVEKIDEGKVARVDKSFILQDFKGKEADLVYWVKLNDQDVIFYILMEMQSTVDFQMPFRLLLYMVEIWRGILKDTSEGYEKTKEFRMPAIVPIILYNGYNNWTACRSFKEYLSGYELFGENIIDFEYILLDVNRYTKEELLKASNIISTVFLIEQKKNDIESMFEVLKEGLDALKGMEPKQFELLKNWFVNIVIRDMDESDADKFKKIIQEVQLYNLPPEYKQYEHIHQYLLPFHLSP
jgi:hypothetical protein